MELSATGLELIKRSEGFVGRPYNDLAGFSTVGYGHKIVPHESFPSGVTEPQAEAILAEDVKKAESAIAQLVKVPLTQGQFDALVDFCFNLGAGRLAGSSLLRELNAGQYAAAGRQLLLWDHAGGKVVPGLKVRRKAELALWTSGETELRRPA